MEILLVPAALILFLYMTFQSARNRKSTFLTLLWISLFVGVTVLCTVFYAEVKASYGGQKEWQQEREFFLRIFVQKLESSGDLKTAAKYMQSEDVKKQTLVCIQKIVRGFRPQRIYGLVIGAVILLGAAASCGIKQINQKKYFPYLLVFFLLLGTVCFNTGVFYQVYAPKTEHYLKNFLRLQQEYVMKELSEIKTELTIPEIVKITLKEAGRVEGFGYGQTLPEQLRSSKTSDNKSNRR